MLIKIIKPFALILTLSFLFLVFCFGWHYFTAVGKVNHLFWIVTFYLAFWSLLFALGYKVHQVADRLSKRKQEREEALIKSLPDNEIVNDQSLDDLTLIKEQPYHIK